MSDQTIIVLSGKKQAGKNTACNFIVGQFMKYKRHMSGKTSWGNHIDDNGFLHLEGNGYQQVTNEFTEEGIKVYSFADPLKRFCIEVLGVPEECCYGTNEQKNTPLNHLLWENLPLFVRWSNSGRKIKLRHLDQIITYEADVTENTFLDDLQELAAVPENLKSGPMTGREVMQVFGTDICRKLYGDCWALGTMNTIKREGYKLALVCDARFPNEIEISKKFGAKVIRMKRKVFDDNHPSEVSLDHYPEDRYDLLVDNQNLSISQTCDSMKLFINKWIEND